MAGQLWRELGASMRAMRQSGGLSLRQAEVVSGWRRGTLSQVENGKARPGASLVEWYDRAFEGHGLLLSAFAEARAAHPAVGPIEQPDDKQGSPVPGDAVHVDVDSPAAGLRVAKGGTVPVKFLLENRGVIPWHRRRMRRVGAQAGTRLLMGERSMSIPDTAPGESVSVTSTVRAPEHPGSVIAYWRMVDADDRYCFLKDDLACVLVVVE